MAGKKLSLEDKFEKLDLLVKDLEKDDISLDESFKLYQKAMNYLKACNEEIKGVEKKVMQLKENGEIDEF